LPDPDDEPFLSVAAAAAAVLISGNLRHFPVRVRAEVTVLSPRAFVDGMRGGG
jgi:predicted nucleic acid-binding protein